MINQFLICKNQDKFPQGLVQKFIETANYVLETSRFTSWDEEKMSKLWRGRPLYDILNNPEINHLFPCLDTAALATYYLTDKNEDVYLKILTDKRATKAFREERARIMHIDSILEFTYKGESYGLDIGCGDITLLRPTNIRNDTISIEEEMYYTTRPETGENIWRRAPFLKVSGKDFVSHKELSPLDFLLTPFNLIKVPYHLTKQDFYTSRDVPDKENILRTNPKDYDPKNSSLSNIEWLETNKDFLNGLKEYQYV